MHAGARRPSPRSRSRRSTASLMRAATTGSTDVALRSFVRAPAQRAARSAARTDRPSRDDLARELAAAVVVGDREHGAGVALGQLAALDHREHVVGQLEQPDPVRDRRLRPADALGDLAERRGRTRRAAPRSRAPPRSARGPRARRSRRGRAAACRGRRPRGSPPAPSARPASRAARQRRSPAISS